MIIRKCLSVLLTVVLALSAWSVQPLSSVAGASARIIALRIGDPVMKIDGIGTAIDGSGTAPVIISGRTLLPVRAIVEALGGTVAWNADRQLVTILLRTANLEFVIGRPTATVNGASVFIDPSNLLVVPVIINGRTMLPLRFIGERLGANVDWSAATRTVTLDFSAPTVPVPAVPVLLTPGDASAVADTGFSLTWTPVENATTYRITVRRGSDTVVDKAGLDTPSFAVPAGVLSPGAYRWTVTATGSGGTSAVQARPFTFTVKEPVQQPLVQTVEMHVRYTGWDPAIIHIKAGAQVTWIIWGDEVTSCTSRIVAPGLGISQALVSGKNVIAFTAPAVSGSVPFACWMNMVRGKFIIDPK